MCGLQTEVDGEILVYTTWRAGGSPYVLNGGMTVYLGDTLIIQLVQQGVTIRVPRNEQVYVE